ncbi:MAG: tetratricopeptide repeat protein [Terracidiphilus sp.]
MRRGFALAVVFGGWMACCMAAGPGACAQSPAGGDAAGAGSAPGQSKPAGDGQKPAGAQSGANPFPEDISTVPVMPSKGTPVLPEGTYNGGDNGHVSLPGDDLDPVRSPDDPAPASSAPEPDSSSSLSGLDKLLPRLDDDQPDGRRKLAVKEQTHKESASNDIDVGKYYLQTRNWRAAQSRFESAMVLDPENPEVYWGLAEAHRHLGDFVQARANYQKLLDYDPEGPHGKEARKALADPQIGNAKSAAATAPATGMAK